MYTYLEIIGSPTGVETEKGSERVSRLTPKFTVIYEVTKEIVAHGSKKAYISM